MGRTGEGNSVYDGIPSSGRAGREPAARRYEWIEACQQEVTGVA